MKNKEQAQSGIKSKKSGKNKWRNSEAEAPQDKAVEKNVIRDG